jgi:hypothetical protein
MAAAEGADDSALAMAGALCADAWALKNSAMHRHHAIDLPVCLDIGVLSALDGQAH